MAHRTPSHCPRDCRDPTSTVPARTEHRDGGVDLLGGVGVELAEVPPLVRDGHVRQRHPQLAVGKVHQLEPAVLQRCGASTARVTAWREATSPSPHTTVPKILQTAAHRGEHPWASILLPTLKLDL